LLQGEVAATPGAPERFAAELAEMHLQLAELETAHEELERQNEELETTREALEVQRHRYLHLFDEAPFGYLITDLQGNVEEANRAAATLFNIAQRHLPGKPLAVFLEDEFRQPFRSQVAQLRSGQPFEEWEVLLRPRGGEPFAAMISGVRDLGERDQPLRLRWTVRDVSARRAAEEALRESEERLRHSQRMEAVGRLAGGIAHSFNNLLAAIAFHSELLAGALPEGTDQRAHVEEIKRAGDRAAVLARQLLAFGRKQILQPRVISVNGVLTEMEPMLRRLIGENIRFETQLDPKADPINADLGQLEQVILNLVVNARDAMPYGGRLIISTTPRELVEETGGLPPGHYVELAVVDTGTGISDDVKARLFEPFFTTKARGQGTGLGLATAHGIVHQSGGIIQVESEPAKGSRFVVLLPCAEGSPEETLQLAPAVWGVQAAKLGSEIVLLVEDEDNIRQPAVEVLESRGYNVLAARDATEALATAESHQGPIHLLVTDVIMPGLSGSQLADRLLPLRPEMRVLYISGYPEDAIAHHGVLDREQNFLQKPFPPVQFLAKVREVLDTIPEPAGTPAGG
jgi:PAS domain S-box-containing protein